MNPRATRLVQDISNMSGEMDTIRAKLNSIKDRYTANGGQSFIAAHFVDADGNPRSDVYISQAKIETAVTRLGEVLTLLNTYKDVFIQSAP